MKRRSALIALMLSAGLAGPAPGQDTGEAEEGFDLLREGTRQILEGLIDDMRPMLEEARPFFEEEMLPFLESLGELIDDMGAYELPERLPNGDIIIRRLPDRPLPDAEEALPEIGEGGEVEL